MPWESKINKMLQLTYDESWRQGKHETVEKKKQSFFPKILESVERVTSKEEDKTGC